MERRKQVVVTVVRDVSAKTLLQEAVKVVKRGALVYTDKFGGYKAPDVLWLSSSDGQ